MKKYNKPTVQVVELSVRESLSAIPFAFKGMGKTTVGSGTAAARFNNISIYTKTSAVKS